MTSLEPSGHPPRRAAADAVRLLIQRLVATDAPDEELAAVADEAHALAERLAPWQQASRMEGLPGPAMLETHPITGPSHPSALPLVVEAAEGRAVVTGTYGHAFEGPPGRLHGGFIAAGFDIALGRAVASVLPGAFTGTLSVRYRLATPLFVPVRYEAEVEVVNGRKATVRGVLIADGQRTADADGLWVAART